tara:strand:+ start:210 stop:1217 length:1008 start_codon:yes stop_codon:yes gene_type:complete
MSIDLGNSPVGTPPTPTEQTQLRTSFGLGAADTVEFGSLETSQFNFPNLTTAELNAVTGATEGDAYFDSDRGQFVRFTGSASYDVITSRSYVPVINATLGAALTLPATRIWESGIFADSPNVFSPQDTLIIYDSKNPSGAANTQYLYHNGEQGPAGWYNAGNPALGLITSAVFTADTLMQLSLSGVRTAFVSGNQIINTETPVELGSAVMKAGSTYEFEFTVGFVDLLGSNVAISVDYSGLLEESGMLTFNNTDTSAGSELFQVAINSPDMPAKVVVATGSFAGVAGSTFGSWTVTGQITPSSDGTLTIGLNANLQTVEPLFYSVPVMSVTLLTA